MTSERERVYRQQDDRVNSRFVVGVAIGAGLLMALGVVWARFEQWRTNLALPGGQQRVSARIGQPEIGMVYQRPFDEGLPRPPRAERLRRYGWVSREARVIHMPIERAMRLLVKRQGRAAQAPEEGP